MKKKEIRDICEASFRRLFSFPIEDYKFVDWDVYMDDDFNEWAVRVIIISKRHVVYRCNCWIDEDGFINNENCRILG